MEELIATVFNVAAKIFGYFYDEWGWSGALFVVFWGGLGILFAGASMLILIRERFGKTRE
jgi:hypothetical protein